MQASPVTINSVPLDVLKHHVWDPALCPATMAVVCKAWRSISEAWFDKINLEIIKENPTLVACYEKVKGTRPCVVLFKQLIWALKHTESYLFGTEDPFLYNLCQRDWHSNAYLHLTDRICLKIPEYKAMMTQLDNCKSQYSHVIEQFVNIKMTRFVETCFGYYRNPDITIQSVTEEVCEAEDQASALQERIMTDCSYIKRNELECLLGQISHKQKVIKVLPQILNIFWPTVGNLRAFPYQLDDMLPVTNHLRTSIPVQTSTAVATVEKRSEMEY